MFVRNVKQYAHALLLAMKGRNRKKKKARREERDISYSFLTLQNRKIDSYIRKSFIKSVYSFCKPL